MIRSMTGYGSASAEDGALRADVAVRSLNHRFLEVGVSLSRRVAWMEPDVKARVQSRLRRGKIDVSVRASSVGESAGEAVVASAGVVSGLVRTLRQIGAEHGLVGDVSLADVARFPGALEVVEGPVASDDATRGALLQLVDRALDGLDAMRRAEGERLAADLCARLEAITSAAGRLAAQSEETREARRDGLLEKVRTVVREAGLEDARVYQEVVRLVDRSDVAEELQRLGSHVGQCRALFDEEAPSGRRLDFLAQEMMREANTIGSKAASACMIQEVVSVKAEIERFREQVQNVE